MLNIQLYILIFTFYNEYLLRHIKVFTHFFPHTDSWISHFASGFNFLLVEVNAFVALSAKIYEEYTSSVSRGPKMSTFHSYS